MSQDDRQPDDLAIPEGPLSVAVITGFLGSGKTTLLRHLLQHPEMGETAVIVNEFGEIGLDHVLGPLRTVAPQLVRQHSEE